MSNNVAGIYGTYVIKWEMDYDTDISFFGSFTDKGDIPDTWPRKRVGWGEPKRYEPYISFEELRDSFIDSGDTWGDACRKAREYIQQDQDFLEKVESNQTWFEYCVVEYHVDGRKLDWRVWGGIHEPDDATRAEVEAELIAELPELPIIRADIMKLTNQAAILKEIIGE